MSSKDGKHESERTVLKHEGHYRMRIERALSLYRPWTGNHVFFVIEGIIEEGPTPDYENKPYAHVCRMSDYSAWVAHEIASAVGGVTAEVAQRAWDREFTMRYVAKSDDLEYAQDERVDVNAIIRIDVTKLADSVPNRNIMIFKFSRE